MSISIFLKLVVYWKITKLNPAQLPQFPSTVVGLKSSFLPWKHNYCDPFMILVHSKDTSSCPGRTKTNLSKEEERLKLVEKLRTKCTAKKSCGIWSLFCVWENTLYIPKNLFLDRVLDM